jgi:hypothetical protein
MDLGWCVANAAAGLFLIPQGEMARRQLTLNIFVAIQDVRAATSDSAEVSGFSGGEATWGA